VGTRDYSVHWNVWNGYGALLPPLYILSWLAGGKIHFHSQKVDKILAFTGIR